jgi:hypothetical protein
VGPLRGVPHQTSVQSDCLLRAPVPLRSLWRSHLLKDCAALPWPLVLAWFWSLSSASAVGPAAARRLGTAVTIAVAIAT